ncbi:MAG: fasciclin domain-containing protein [Gammaproteobacteria bacterium]|nr:fasciclin domain-containing protein [Gammaproteobacteria bacterium]
MKYINSASFISLLFALMFSMNAFSGHHGEGHKKGKSIVEVASSNEDFSTLVAAVKAAGLVDTLAGKGPFTVFAPTNEAFAKLPEGTVESLLKPENKDKLVAILTYHVVPGKVKAKDVIGLSKATSVQGSDIKVSTKDGAVMVDNAKVIKTDLMANNGVVHVIDTVILPR